MLSKLLEFLNPKPKGTILVPNINLTFPTKLPSCHEIVLEGHKDPRLLVWSLYYLENKPFSSESFSDYVSADVGDIQIMLKTLEDRKWIAEKAPAEILTILYTADELRTFLQTHNLKISGKKEDLAKRLLENVPFNKFKRKYKHTLYELTELGTKSIQEKKTDYDRTFINAVNFIKSNNFQGAVDAYNAFDHKWGFIHANGKEHTIFANYFIPHKRFNYIAKNPMLALQNSNEFKQDLRAFLLASLMCYTHDSSILAERFSKINNEQICCPGIISMYKQDRNDDIDKAELERIIESMQKRIKEEPDCVLDYYISKIFYNSRHI